MTIDEKVAYWVGLSDEDLKAGVTLLQGGHYLYVGFMCHQSIEKILKAYFSKVKEKTPPFVHNLIYLAIKCEIYDDFSQTQQDFIDELNPLNIEARYPEYKNIVAKSLTKNRCEAILDKTKNLQQWIKEKI